MDPSLITATEVRRIIEHMRSASGLGDSPLLDSAMVAARLHATGTRPGPESREWALAEIVTEQIVAQLGRCRDAEATLSGSAPRPSQAPPVMSLRDAERARIKADFLSDDMDREAWSSLFYRYIHSPPLQVQDLAALTRPRSHGGRKFIYRRTERGIHLLTQRLLRLDEAANARPAATTDAAVGPAHPRSEGSRVFTAASSSQATDSPRHNLPTRRSSFVGRDRAVAEVAARLHVVPMLTLTGPGGVGKTRLMLHAACAAIGDFPDGVWLVELASVTDPARVPDAILDALVTAGAIDAPEIEHSAEAGAKGGDMAGPAVRPLAQVTHHLRTRTALLVLDNCEHLVDACARAADTILTTCPNVRILASSHEVLGVEGEHVYHVTPLETPPESNDSVTLDLMKFPAVKLFVDRAWAGEPRFDSSNGHGPTVAAICRRLDGLPLAIELAAVWARSMSVGEILAHLDHRLALLVQGPRAARPEHQGLRVLLEWSHVRLDPAEQLVFRRLSVFHGGCGLAEAELVCAEGDVAPSDVPRLVFRLVGKSLVDMVEADDQARYTMLDTIHEYAAEMLTTSEDDAPVRDRHALAYLALAERAEPELQGADQAGRLRELRRDHANLRAALDRSLARPEMHGVGLRLAGALSRFWLTQGFLAEGRTYLAAAIALDQPPEASPARAKALLGCGMLARQQCDYGLARQCLENAIAIQSSLTDRQGVAATLRSLGNIAEEQGQVAEARRLYEQSLAGYHELGDRWGEAAVLNNLGLAAYHAGEFEAARPWMENSLAIFRALGEAWAVSVTLFNLGNLSFDQGDLDSAERLLLESLAIARGLDDPAGIAGALGSLGYIAYRRGDHAAARACYRESFPLLAESGDQQDIAEWLESLALLAQAEDKPALAAQLFGAASALRVAIGVPVAAKDAVETAERIAALRTEMGDAAFEAAWSAGELLDWRQIAGSALHA